MDFRNYRWVLVLVANLGFMQFGFGQEDRRDAWEKVAREGGCLIVM